MLTDDQKNTALELFFKERINARMAGKGPGDTKSFIAWIPFEWSGEMCPLTIHDKYNDLRWIAHLHGSVLHLEPKDYIGPGSCAAYSVEVYKSE